MKVGIISKAMVVLALLALVVLTGCPDPNTDMEPEPEDRSITLSLVTGCFRLYGDADCRVPMANGMLAAETSVGTVAVEGATAFSISSQTPADRYAIDETSGEVTVQTAFAVTATTADTIMVDVTTSAGMETRPVIVSNVQASGTMQEAPLAAARDKASDTDGDTLTVTDVTSGEGEHCKSAAPCLSGAYTHAWAGWFYSMQSPIDLTSYDNAYIVYKLTDTDDDSEPGYEFKLESAGIADGQYVLNGADGRLAVVDDGAWQTIMIPRTTLHGLNDASGGGFNSPADDPDTGLDTAAITKVGIWSWGTNNVLIIDEIYFR